MAQQHTDTQDRGQWIGDTLAGYVRRAAVDRFIEAEWQIVAVDQNYLVRINPHPYWKRCAVA